MTEINDHIRAKLKEAREEAGLSQRQFADLVLSAQGTISDLERGKIRINASDLARFAEVLDKSVMYFYPGLEETDLTENEQLLLMKYRRLPPRWQESILDQVEAQSALHNAMASSRKDEDRISALPEDEREDEAYKTVYRYLRPLFRIGFRLYVDNIGHMTVGHRRIPSLRLPYPLEDELDRKIALELQRRYDLNGLDD